MIMSNGDNWPEPLDSKVRQALKQDGTHGCFIIWCPGCGREHTLDTRWEWNENMTKPTFTPSLLYPEIVKGSDVWQKRCHSFITDGNIRFFDDSSHDKKGQTVELLAVDKWPD